MDRIKKHAAGISGRMALAGLISVSVLLICSKNSPLYPMNDWVDVNCFFTVGRGMRHGLMPYLDLYDQKGPLLYAVYALAAWISETSFTGVFLIETICFAVFLFFSGRTAETLSDTPAAYWLTTAGLGIGVPLSPAFSHGGSAEELFLPVLALSLYLVLKTMHTRETLMTGQAILLGACAAAALWTKYTFCGLYAGLMLAVAVQDYADFRGRHLIRLAGQSLIGAGMLTVTILVRYAAVGALPAMWQAYFVDNLAHYSENIRSGNYAMPLPNLLNNLSWSAAGGLGMIWLLLSVKCRWRETAAFVCSAVFLFAFTYASGRRYPYYAIVMAVFSAPGFAALFAQIPSKVRDKHLIGRVTAALTTAMILFSLFAARSWSGNVYLLQTDQSEMPQYRFAETIRQSEDSSLLNYGFLDGGFYFAAESLPATRFFCTLNNDLTEMQQEHRAAVAEGKTEFVITRQRKLKNADQYMLIDQADMMFEGRTWTYYLYRRKAARE